MADQSTIIKVEDEEERQAIQEATEDEGELVEDEFKYRIVGYMRALDQKKVDIADALNISPQYYYQKYHKHPRSLQYKKEYENKLLTEIEADFTRVVKELKSIAYAEVTNIRPSDKIRALEDIAKLMDKVPSDKVEIQGRDGGPVELAAVRNYEQFSDEELEKKIEERVREIKGT